MLAILPRLAAAFNRSTLLIDSDQPDGENPADYYANAITNHYARIVHATTTGGRGYAFPYDDVAPSGGADQSGAVSDPAPTLLTVTLGSGPLTRPFPGPRRPRALAAGRGVSRLSLRRILVFIMVSTVNGGYRGTFGQARLDRPLAGFRAG